ncbi:hypothetical protein OPT61_g3101 [Boeremia exigua]|uniref:Uncharacterized protein n=1 Tax=Boeremia exigua TaxID=749465 RepID=A0ACC2IJ49_9PLEO|nr:hypothetical protein OPT61_g3101 [Boeremia exigua]
MPPKRKKRRSQNYEAWRQGPRAAPYWAKFEEGFLKSGQFAEGQKGEEFLNVYNQILQGESNGGGKYSSDGAEAHLQNAMDWQAWLLVKLVHNNVSYRNGCLYGCTDPKPVIYEKMWNTIKNELRNRSRQAKGSQKAVRTTKPTAKKRSDGSSSESGEELNPNDGMVLVTWVNLPISLRKTVSNTEEFEKFCGYNLPGFRAAVEARFGLASHQHVILELVESNNSTFTEAQSVAAQEHNKDGVFFALKTRKATLQQEVAPLPPAVIATPQAHKSKNEPEQRRLAWAEMIADARSKNSKTLDLSVPLWQFSFLKSLGDDTKVSIEDVVLNLGEVNDEETALEYTHGLLDLTKALKDKDEIKGEGSEDSEGPPLTRYREITQEEKDAYREQAQWLDNKVYQREDHNGACARLGIQDPARPRMDGLYPAQTFEFYQPTAIDAMVSFEDANIRGGLLADDMGLGKTVEIIGLMLFRSNQRKLAIKNGEQVSPALPTLILMPRTLVIQWKDEILKFTDRFRVVVYYGTPKNRTEEGVVYHKGKITRSSDYFNGDERNADTIVLSTYTTWAIRHGPKAQTTWLIDEHMRSAKASRQKARLHVEKSYKVDVATKSCAIQLQDCFERVILDEGHEIRHMSPQVGISVRWVGGKYRNVVTGTPILNGLVDFCGIMRFLQPPELESMEHIRSLGIKPKPHEHTLKDILKLFDPWSVEDDDPRATLRYSVAAIDQWVFHKNTSNEQRGLKMRKVFQKCMLRRSMSSTINGKRIGDCLPEVQRINIECAFTDVERQYYDYMYADTSSRLFKKKGENNALAWNTTTYRKLCLITSWLGLGYLLEYKAAKLKKIREHKDNAVRFLKDVRIGQARVKIPEAQQLPLPKDEDTAKMIQQHCTGSPKLRQLLAIIAELVVLQKEKITVWVNSPFQMEWLDSVFKLCRLESRQLRADLAADERDKLIQQFLQDPKSPQIMICSYLISCAGINMHLRCRTVIEFEPAPCQGVRDQMVGRVRRKGQTRFCRHIKLTTKDSFNTQQDAVTLLRSLPMLMTQLDLDVFGKQEEEMDRDCALGDWVLFNNDLVPAADPKVTSLNLPTIDPDTLLMYISLKMAGHKLEGDILSLKKAAKGLKQNQPAKPTIALWK